MSPITLWFYGFNAAGMNTVALQQSFTIAVPSMVGADVMPELNSFFFNSNFVNLSGLAWFQQSGPTGTPSTGSAFSHQFTNIEGEVVPEPSTFILMGTGLLALFIVRRRRSA